MSRLLALADAVDADLAIPFLWYERQLTGLGVAFLQQIDDTLARIALFPESYQLHFADFRCAQVRRYPYAVFYRLKPQVIEVDAILDCRIDPETVQARLTASSSRP